MKIICTQENLKNGLGYVLKNIPTGNSLPVFKNFLLSTENGQLEITSVNLDIAIVKTIRCKIENEGKVCVPAKTFYDLVTSFHGGNVTLEVVENNTLRVTTESYNGEISVLPASEYPPLPEVDIHVSFSLPGDQIRQALTEVVFATHQKDNQSEMTGVLLYYSSGLLKFVATDRYRLAEKTIESEIEKPFKVIVPQKTISEIIRLTQSSQSEITFDVSQNQIIVSTFDVKVFGRTLQGEFPDYEQIMPSTFNFHINCPKVDLVSALRAASVFMLNSTTVDIKINSHEEVLEVSTEKSALGGGTQKIPIVVDGEDLQIMLNFKYILDFLQVVDDKNIVIRTEGFSSSVQFSPENDKMYKYVVMPVFS